MRTAIQLYTLRDRDEPVSELFAEIADAGFDGVEFGGGVGTADPAATRTALDDAGLAAASAHVDLETLEEDFDAAIETARELGYEDLVVPWLDPEHFESVAAVEDAAERLDAVATEVAEAGMRLHYHNHDQEFAGTEQGTAFHVLAALAEDLWFEIDAGWALAGGADPVALLRQYGDRVTYVHVKDVALGREGVTAVDIAPEDIPPLGEGDLDVGAVVGAAREIDAEWLIYENDEPEDPATTVHRGAEVLERHL